MSLSLSFVLYVLGFVRPSCTTKRSYIIPPFPCSIDEDSLFETGLFARELPNLPPPRDNATLDAESLPHKINHGNECAMTPHIVIITHPWEPGNSLSCLLHNTVLATTALF
jgi:hypothetical protein